MRAPAVRLQDCCILLIHGQRAAYFPSPYVDAYGERHRSIRGRPLFLDERRYGVVRGLWVNHLVAHEVCQAFSTSGRLVGRRCAPVVPPKRMQQDSVQRGSDTFCG